MTRRFLGCSVVVLAMSVCGCAGVSAQRSTLDDLHVELQWIRGGHDGDPRSLEAHPPVEALVGARVGEISARLGPPRTCRMPIEAPCRAPGETIWSFYRGGSDGETESGSVLVVELDAAGRVLEARWRHPEVAASPPLAPTSSSTAAIASSPSAVDPGPVDAQATELDSNDEATP